MSKEIKITFSELMKTLDEFRGKKCINRIISPDQRKFMEKCRNNLNPVAYKTMAELWMKVGWGKMTESTMRNTYLRESKKGQ